MIATDTSFLIDYLDGRAEADEFVEEHRDVPFFAPTVALFEAYRGGTRTGGSEHVDRIEGALGFVRPLAFDAAVAHEAALLEAELLDAGKPINLGDVLIAATCRHHGAGLVTDDDHFENVDGLEVVDYTD
jgi:tRNA(fMet)-specific endonuclease VapC